MVVAGFVVFIVTLIWVHLLYVVTAHYSSRHGMVMAAVALVACFSYFYATSSPYAQQTQATALAWQIMIVTTLPMTITQLAVWLSKGKTNKCKHAMALVLALINGMTWPLLALLTSCMLQLDCI